MACFIMSINVASSVGLALAMGAVVGAGVRVSSRARERDAVLCSTNHVALWICSRVYGDESTHQILSYGLLFSTFYRFPYTAGPPTSTAPTRPSPTIVRTFAIVADYTLYPSHHRSGTTSEISHMTYGPHRYISLS